MPPESNDLFLLLSRRSGKRFNLSLSSFIFLETAEVVVVAVAAAAGVIVWKVSGKVPVNCNKETNENSAE